MYKIKVNGFSIPADEIKVSAYPFNRTWPGKQRDISQTETAYMLRIFGRGAIELEIETEFPIYEATIRPLSTKILPKIESTKLSFTIPGNGKFSIEINGVHHAIHLLYQEGIKKLDFPSPTYHFKSGHHNIGLLKLESGDSVYIEKNAIVHGSLFAVDEENITIYGDGILCGDHEERTQKHGDIGFDNENSFAPEDVHTYGGIRMYRCKNITIKGITITDTASYAVSFFASENISIDDTNVLGLWKYNCDGIDFFNSQNIVVKNCFIRSFDDSMCMKGLTAFSEKSTTNAEIYNCVFWCDWGKNLDIGLATACPEISNITWHDCDIIHNNGSCITISVGQWADVHDIYYKNIRIEYSKDTQMPVLQKDDREEYHNEKTHVPFLARISDKRRNWQGNVAGDDETPKIRNVEIDDIYVYMEDGINEIPHIIIDKTIQSSFYGKIHLKNFFINGKTLDVSSYCID